MRNNIKVLCGAVGGLIAACAGLAAIYPVFSRTVDVDSFNNYKANIINLSDVIYYQNVNTFKSGEKLSKEEYSKFVLETLSEENKKGIRETVVFLESVIECKQDFFCKLSSDSDEYDKYTYTFWYLTEPYILEIKNTQVGKYSETLEEYAKKLKEKFDNNT